MRFNNFLKRCIVLAFSATVILTNTIFVYATDEALIVNEAIASESEVLFGEGEGVFENATQICNAVFGPGENNYKKQTNINTNSITAVMPENTGADPDRPALGPGKLQIGQPYFQYNYYPIEKYGDPLDSNKNDKLFYYFEAKQDGKYTVTLNANATYYLTFERINELGDSDSTNPIAKIINTEETKQLSAGLKAGIYLISVNANNNASYGDKVYIRVDYESVNNETDKDWIKLEPNEDFSEAMSIPLNTNITGSKCIGQSSESGKNDYFKFEIPQNGIVTFSNASNIIDIYLYTGKKDSICAINYTGENEKKLSRSVGLAAGSYYLKVVGVLDETNYDATKYSFKVDFSPNERIEIEPNLIVKDATLVEANTTYWASCIKRSDVDIFKFTLPSATKNLKVNFSKDMTGAKIYVGKESGIGNYNSLIGNSYTVDKELDAGEYYMILSLFDGTNITEENNSFLFNIGGEITGGDPATDKTEDIDDVVKDDTSYFPSGKIITDNTVTVTGVSDATYTGSAITFDLRVYVGKALLKEGTDYSVKYLNNKNVPALDAPDSKKPQIVITGKGNYKDSKTYKFDTIYFAINPIDISELEKTGDVLVTNDTVLSSDKKKLVKPAPTITLNGKKLTKNDYSIDYGAGKETGIDTSIVAKNVITLTGKGNYKGNVTSDYEVVLNPSQDKNANPVVFISKATVTGLLKNIAYDNGNEIQQKGYKVNCKVGNKAVELVEGTDYTVAYADNREVGTASMIIKAKPSNDKGLVGEKVLTFKITGIATSKLTIDCAKNLEYTGDTIKPGTDGQPTLTVTDKADKNNSKNLMYGKDYEVDYLKNVQTGTATMLITGKGKYFGTVKKTFKIVPVDMGKNSLIKAEIIDGSVKKETSGKLKDKYTVRTLVTFNGKTLKEGRDYVLTYKYNTENDVAKGKQPQVILNGKGNYSKQLGIIFDINKN